MPVTAKLSKAFYDKLGEEIANELVEWFNGVDATYRADLRQLNELNFARFDAKLEQRVLQLEGRMVQLESRMDQRFVQLEAKLEQRLTAVRADLSTATADFRRGLADLRSELLKWMFLFWVTTLGSLILLRGHP